MREPFIRDSDFTLYVGDVLEVLRELPSESAHMCVTSPPYWNQRDYGTDGQLGLEATPDEYVTKMVEVFREVRRVLRDDGTLWLNIGDSYAANRSYQVNDSKHPAHEYGESNATLVPAGLKAKDLIGIPWMLAFALRADGWWLRSEIIWSKPNAMPESVHDRPTCAHEHVFLLSKSGRYFYDKDAVKEEAEWARWGKQTNPKYDGTTTKGGFIKERSKKAIYGYLNESGNQEGMTKNLRNVWEITTQPYPDAHFATFPEALVEPCIKAGSPEDGVVLDPFMGSGTTAVVARKLCRKSIGIELKLEYAQLCAWRTSQLSVLT